jgi:GDPmannose 4,6-dehydratase
MKKALITGIGGQDGAYLAAHLLSLGYEVAGTSRDASTGRFQGLGTLGIRDRVTIHSMSPADFRSTLQVVARVRPDEIYNLAGQTSVFASFEKPVETLESIVMGVVNLLESIRILATPIRLFSAGSSEMFGNTGVTPATEATAIEPRSPYGIAKATGFWQVAQYRETYAIHACTGILFNHESPLRPERFVTQKIVAAACRIATGGQQTLRLGNLAVHRDWGWAPEYVVAMHAMLQQDEPEDLVIATGRTFSLESFVEEVFRAVGLDWRRHVTHDRHLERPTDISCVRADPSRARDTIGWQARHCTPDVARMMVAAHLAESRPVRVAA